MRTSDREGQVPYDAFPKLASQPHETGLTCGSGEVVQEFTFDGIIPFFFLRVPVGILFAEKESLLFCETPDGTDPRCLI